MGQRNIRWLYGELPGLVDGGVVSEDTAARLRDHYGPAEGVSASRLAVVLCGVLGAALIGSGIILLIAHNWEFLGRPARTVLSFLPLILGQALVAWALLRHGTSAAWRESTSTFLALAVGSSIALIGQTYHIPGNLASFLFTWLWLGLPLVYLQRSAMVLVLYLIGTVCWAVEAQQRGGQALLYWVFLAAVLPAVLEMGARRPGTPRSALIHWAFALSLCIGVGVVLEKVLPGLWIVAYGALFGCFYFLGQSGRFAETPGRPLVVVGGVGTVVLSLLLTYDHWWRRIGYGHYRGGNYRYVEWAGIHDYVLVLALLGAVAYLAVRAFGRGDRGGLVWAASPLLCCIAFALANAELPAGAITLLFNGYLFALGVLLLRAGVVAGRLGLANGGMGVLAALFALRFIDSDMAIVVRGVAFILIGAGFLGANLWLARNRVQGPEEVQS